MYERMCLIRKYEESIYYLFLEGIMPGSIHQSTGQEACAVGMLYDLTDEDYVASTHRPAGHCLAKGVTLQSMMCEMFGKEEGCCHGKGGAMHTGDIHVGVVPANAIVGGNLPIAAGIALSNKMRKTNQVVVCFMGDGATNEGSFHESMNFAAVWKLPVIYVCENNLYSATTSIKRTTLLEDVAAGRAAAYGMEGIVVDGNDVLAVNEVAVKAIKKARAGKGPTLIELKTYRHGGHSRNDACGYRPKEEEKKWFDRDPLKLFRAYLIEHKIATEQEIVAIDDRIQDEVDEAVEYAQAAAEPALESALHDIYWEGEND
ncbi:thiamine pyrophosphate-dependent dehydrogenase E1 component subunit alpha [Christensenella hongkongensis]